jgi:hypothetical protein
MLLLTFIDDIPVGATASVPPHDLVDVVLHHRLQRLVVPVPVGHPARQLTVPNERVATQLVPAGRGSVGMLVRAVPVELILVRLDSIPLHGVLGRDGTKVILVVENVALGAVVAHRHGRAKVRLASGHHGSLEASGLARGQHAELSERPRSYRWVRTYETSSAVPRALKRATAAAEMPENRIVTYCRS